MTASTRRERERSDRHQLIIATARELAETEGWDAVTTRRLADRVEYSQPVLYSHFANKQAIIQAVALEGFTEMAAVLKQARSLSVAEGAESLRAVFQAYLDFAATRPAVYEAMFTLPIGLAFGGTEDTPAPLKDAFHQIIQALQSLAGDRDVLVLAEVTWSALHGTVDLVRSGRLFPDTEAGRLTLLVHLVTAGVGNLPAVLPLATVHPATPQ